MSIIAAGVIICLSALPARAQEDVRPIPSWVSDRGYWVVENNTDSTVVYFYDNDSQLVCKRGVKGRLNTDRKKTKLWLTKELEQLMTAWERGRKQMMDGVSGLSRY